MLKYYENQTFNIKISFGLVLLISGLILNIGFPVEVHAQQSKTQSAIIPDSLLLKQQSLAIPLSSVASEGQKSVLTIRDIKTRIEAIKIEVNIDSLLTSYDNDFKNLVDTAFEDKELKKVSLRTLKDFYRDFSQLKVQLKNIKKLVLDKYDALTPNLDQTNQLQQKWKITDNSLSKDDVPKPIQERIESILKNIEALKTEITDKQNKFLVYEDRVTTMMIGVDEALDKINAQNKIENEQFFKQNSPPIWNQLKADGDTVSIRYRSHQSFESQKKDVQTFFKNYQNNIVSQLIFLVIFFFLLWIIKKKVKGWAIKSEDKKLNAALYIINLPFVSALTISILLIPLYYPEASQTATRLIFLLSIVPIIFLLPGLIPFIKKTYFYLFGLLFLLEEACLYLESYYLIGRLALILYSLIAIIILFTAIRPKSPLIVSLREQKLENPIFILQFTLVLYTVGLVANIFGFTVLSNIVIEGSFKTFFAGIIIYTGAIILKSLVSLFMISDLSKKLNVVKLYPDDIRKGLNQIINIVAVVYFVIEIMKVFLIFNPIVKWLTAVLTKRWEVGDVGITIGSFFVFFITLWISFFLSKIIRIVLQDEILTRLHMKKGVPEAISMMVHIVLVTLGLVLACSAAGINLSNITIIFGALSVGVGFGLQDIVRNFISGLIIAFERPIRKGDVIKLAGLNLMGEVIEIGIRATLIKTYDGTEVVVPNGNLTSSEMINCTLSDRNMRRELSIGVEYGTDTNKVLEILNKTVSSNKRVFSKPAPWIIFTGFGESSLNFRVTFWANFDIGMTVLSEVGAAIDKALKDEGITIPYPQRVLHMGSKDESFPSKTEEPKIEPKEE